MNRRAWLFRGALVFGLLFPLATRSVLATNYNDGGTHTISGSDTDISISNGTTVNVVTGASVTGFDTDPVGQNAITVVDGASTLNVSGGTVTAGSGSHVGGNGVSGENGTFTFSGGNFNGGSSGGAFTNEPGGDGAQFSNFVSLSISGGTFLGGTGYPGENGYGVALSGGSAPAQISGGTFGSSSSGGLSLAGGTADISNGTFNGGMLSQNSAVANVSGGSFNSFAVWDLYNTSRLDVSGGSFNNSASLNFFDTSQAAISAGTLGEINLNTSSLVTISGGALNGEISQFNNSVLNLSGGMISNHVLPPNFYLQDSAIMNVYGTGLSLTSLGGPDYQLAGTLSNGNVIPRGTEVEIFNAAVVNLITTPEPSTLFLAGLGLVGLAVWAGPSRRPLERRIDLL